MPNWCTNELNLYGPKEDVESFMKKVVQEEGKICLFESTYPTPVELMGEATFKKVDELTPEDLVLIEEYGASDWYHWRINKWGTKWESEDTYLLFERDIEGKEEFKEIAYRFDTAWGPAIDWQKKVSEDYPNIIFHLWYEETGMGFAGTLTNFGGETKEEVGTQVLAKDPDMEYMYEMYKMEKA
jgi:hypothetical protein